VGKSRERIEQEFAWVGVEAPQGSKLFKDSDRRWVPGDLRLASLNDCALEVGREVAKLSLSASAFPREEPWMQAMRLARKLDIYVSSADRHPAYSSLPRRLPAILDRESKARGYPTFEALVASHGLKFSWSSPSSAVRNSRRPMPLRSTSRLAKGQVRVLHIPDAIMLQRYWHAIQMAYSIYETKEETKVLLYSIDPHDWRTADPFRTTGTEFLWEFIEAGSSPDRVFRCAKKYGPLGLCECGIPYGHSLTSFGVLTCTPVGLEAYPAWQHFAGVTEAIIKASAHLNCDELARDRDWLIIAHHSAIPNPHHPKWKRVPVQKKVIMRILGRWRELGDRIAPDRVWGAVEDESGGGLFGKIARELTYVVGQKDGKVVCEHCWRGFVPSRVNQPRVPYFCKRKACQQRASRESTRRARAQKITASKPRKR
jgi:hypothetical protein